MNYNLRKVLNLTKVILRGDKKMAVRLDCRMVFRS
jgi:hypothetical protein